MTDLLQVGIPPTKKGGGRIAAEQEEAYNLGSGIMQNQGGI